MTALSGCPLDVLRTGRGSRVILVHGAAGPLETWREQLPLGERWELLVPSMRGYGSSPPSRHRDFEQDAQDLLGLLDDPAHLVGFSYGAVATLVVAGMRPQQVCSLTVIEPPLLGIALDVPAVKRLAEAIADPFSDPRYRRERVREAFSAFGAEDAEAEAGVGGFSVRLARIMRLLRGARFPGEADPDLDAIIAAGVPVLVVSGGHHAALEAIAERLATLLLAEHALAPGRGHFIPRTSALTARLESFLDATEHPYRARAGEGRGADVPPARR